MTDRNEVLEKKRLDIRRAYRHVFNTPDGKIVLDDMIDMARGVTCYSDPYKTTAKAAVHDFIYQIVDAAKEQDNE